MKIKEFDSSEPEEELEFEFTLNNVQLRILTAMLLWTVEQCDQVTAKTGQPPRLPVDPDFPIDKCLEVVGGIIEDNSEPYIEAIEQGLKH